MSSFSGADTDLQSPRVAGDPPAAGQGDGAAREAEPPAREFSRSRGGFGRGETGSELQRRRGGKTGDLTGEVAGRGSLVKPLWRGEGLSLLAVQVVRWLTEAA